MVRSANSTTSKSSLFVAVGVTIAMLYFGRPIFIPLALALVLSFLLTPFVSLLERIRIGRVAAVVLALTLCFTVTAGVSWRVGDQLLEITAHIGDYRLNVEEKLRSLRSPRGGSLSQATNTVKALNKELSITPETPATAGRTPDQPNASAPPTRPIPVQVTSPPSNFVRDLTTVLGPLAGPVETAGIVIVFTAFMLIKREDLRNRLIRLGGQGRLNVMTQALDDASRRLSRYLLLQFLVNTVYGFLFGLGLYVIGVPHAFLWGAVAAILRLVPYVGTLIATAFPVAIALAVFPGWKHAALSFGIFLILELVIANIVEPWLYGAHTGISSLAILVAAVFWAMLWGPVGLILSTPLTVCLMLMGKYVPQLDFLEVLLGDEPVLKPEEHVYQRLLAMDPEEIRDIAEAHLQEKPLESLYGSVLIPALRLAEEDRHLDALGDQISKSIIQNTRELLEDLEDRFVQEVPMQESDARSVVPDPQLASATVACVPARDDADELIGIMLAHLLRQSGSHATYIAIGAVDEMIEQVSRGSFSIVCISALPPFAVGQARSLCKRLRARFPDLAIVVGLWEFSGGVPKAKERIGTACADAVATTLPEALLQVRRLAQSIPAQQCTETSA